VAVGVPDSADRLPAGVHPELAQAGDRCGHQALSAGFVDRLGRASSTTVLSPARAAYTAVASPAGRSDDKQVCVGHWATASLGAGGFSASAWAIAVFSEAIRTLSSAALVAVKTAAVIQAVCTSGSAIPSATTAP